MYCKFTQAALLELRTQSLMNYILGALISDGNSKDINKPDTCLKQMTVADTKDRMCHECRVCLSSRPCLMKVSSWSFISNIVTNQHCRSLFCSLYRIQNNVSGLSTIAKRLIAYCKQSASIKLMFSPIDRPL